jgi:hypothetical protein
MATPIPQSEPTTFRAGATLQFNKTLNDYPASAGWGITYSLRMNEGSTIDFSSSASGDVHAVSVAASTTGAWLPGTYYGCGIVTKTGGVSVEVWAGQIEILPNLAIEVGGYDPRTQARKILDNINAVLEGRATHDVLNSSIEGTVIGRMPVEQLLMIKDRYDAIVMREQAAERIKSGKGSGKQVYVRFVNPGGGGSPQFGAFPWPR